MDTLTIVRENAWVREYRINGTLCCDSKYRTGEQPADVSAFTQEWGSANEHLKEDMKLAFLDFPRANIRDREDILSYIARTDPDCAREMRAAYSDYWNNFLPTARVMLLATLFERNMLNGQRKVIGDNAWFTLFDYDGGIFIEYKETMSVTPPSMDELLALASTLPEYSPYRNVVELMARSSELTILASKK